MKNVEQTKAVHDSWYHQKWFRILLAVVAVDMVVLGVAMMFNVDIFSLIQGFHGAVRVIIGFLYVVVALWIIYYVFTYKKLHRELSLLSQENASQDTEQEHKKEA